jgi:5-(carboxyamino)imidazole ribonucleotide synthase
MTAVSAGARRPDAILPGATLGVLGSGQLGRMFAIAARRMGYRVHVLSPDDDTPTGQVADLEINAAYEDLDAIERFARGVSVVTFEFENVPAAATAAAARHAPVRPGGEVLHTTQNRLREKTFLASAGLPVTPFAAIRGADDLRAALATIGTPSVLKTADWGYDGKGQVMIRDAADAEATWARLATREAVLEAFIDFECELSVVAARGADGAFVPYGPIANTHKDHILDLSVLPADLPPRVAADAIDIARTVMEKLDVVGVLCVELFLLPEGASGPGRLLVNELAPRPHNSGHLTIDACVTCQFEQQVRAVCGLPLGSRRTLSPAAMVNLLGDLWRPDTPDWRGMCELPEVKLHLYGKREPRRGRKMGHLTALAASPGEAAKLALMAREALTRQGHG